MESLRSLTIFLAVADALSFAAAARRLGLSSSATGKAIGALEARLGIRLFNRTTRRVSLTPEGQMLLGRARRLHDEWRETEALLSASGVEPQGLLRLSLPAVGYRFLAPHLAAFARAYPKVRLDLDFDDRINDIVAEGFDLAIRSGALPDSALMSRKLGVFKYFVCAAPSYVAARGEPETITALSDHRVIRFRHPGTDVLQDWRLASAPAAEIDRATQAVICTNMEAVRVAAISGLGVAWVPDFLIEDALKSGQLILLLKSVATEGAFWLLWPPSRQTSPRLRAFLDFATARLFSDRPA